MRPPPRIQEPHHFIKRRPRSIRPKVTHEFVEIISASADTEWDAATELKNKILSRLLPGYTYEVISGVEKSVDYISNVVRTSVKVRFFKLPKH